MYLVGKDSFKLAVNNQKMTFEIILNLSRMFAKICDQLKLFSVCHVFFSSLSVETIFALQNLYFCVHIKNESRHDQFIGRPIGATNLAILRNLYWIA